MKRETLDQKWNRLQALVQDGIGRAYPNPQRAGCPHQGAIAELARRSAGFDDSMEEDAQWGHVTHCSPCYAEYLEEFRKADKRTAGPGGIGSGPFSCITLNLTFRTGCRGVNVDRPADWKRWVVPLL